MTDGGQIVVRHRRIARIGYPLATLLFAAMALAGVTQGSLPALLVGFAGAVVAGIWSATARLGCLVVTPVEARLRTARGWQHPIRFDELRTASWTKTRSGGKPALGHGKTSLRLCRAERTETASQRHQEWAKK